MKQLMVDGRVGPLTEFQFCKVPSPCQEASTEGAEPLWADNTRDDAVLRMTSAAGRLYRVEYNNGTIQLSQKLVYFRLI